MYNAVFLYKMKFISMQKNSLNEIFQRIGEKTFLRTVKKESIHSPQAADFCYFMPKHPFPPSLSDTELVEVPGKCPKHFFQFPSTEISAVGRAKQTYSFTVRVEEGV